MASLNKVNNNSQGETSQEPIIIVEKIAKKNEEPTFRKYNRGKVLGKGGFATCYEITDLDANHTMAVKIISKSTLTKKRALEKLLVEIKVHKSLTHENVVHFERVFEDKDNVYIVMELCPNQTLKELLKKRKRLSEPECVLYLSQTIGAVKHMHEKKIVHRDLKLGNLFLGKAFDVKVGDFGLAAKIEYEGERRRTICGTPNYIAPEVLDKKIGHSYEVDIWSIGVICYTLLIGKPPFETNDTKTTYRKILKNSYSFPSSVSISDEAKDLIKNILVLDPAQRLTLDQIMNHPFIKAHQTEKPQVDLTLNLLKQPIATLQTLHSPENNRLSTHSERGFQFPTIGQELAVDSPHDVNKLDGDNKENLQIPKLFEPGEKVTSKAFIAESGFKSSARGSKAGGFTNRVIDASTNGDIGPTVIKWIDYSNKYGMAYILSDGTSGVVYNDTTRLTWACDETRLEFTKKESGEKKENIFTYNMANYPKDLGRKVLILKYLKDYLSEGQDAPLSEKTKQKDVEEKNNSSLKAIILTYVKCWIKTQKAIVFKLSSRIVQADFIDKTQIIINPHTQMVNYKNKRGEVSMVPLLSNFDYDSQELAKRLKYIKEVLIYMQHEERFRAQSVGQLTTHLAKEGVTGNVPAMNIFHGLKSATEYEKDRI